MVTEFTPWVSLAGGMMIGLAAALLMFTRGRIFGATGILTGFINPESSSDWSWRAALLGGMVTAPLIVFGVTGQMPAASVPIPTAALIVGGVIVGIGVTFGGGCTSGHGVCGNARFSRRSIVATATFMAFAFATVFVIRHVIGGF